MRPGGGSLAKVFPEAGELGREQRRASAPAPTPTPGCPPGDWSFGGETGELGEAASRCSAPRDTSTRAGDPQLLCWARAHFSHLRVALALGLWVWPPGASTFLCPQHLKEEAVVLRVWGPGPKANV